MSVAMRPAAGVLSLTELERHDPEAPPPRGRERRFLCPLPSCGEKQNPRRHRSLSVNVESGAYYCHRCQARGGLQDVVPAMSGARWEHDGRSRLRRAFALQPPKASTTAPLEHAEEIGVPVAEVPAALAYLQARGIPEELASAAGVRFCERWSASAGSPDDRAAGWHAVLFPMRDRHGVVLAAHGRAIAGSRKLTRGPTSSAVFATPGALQRDTVAVTEGPMDALSLAHCGLPAVAIIGTNAPHWLCTHAFSRRILIATDADEAGDAAAAALTHQLGSYGARLERLRPVDGCKDWNDVLQAFGPAVLRFLLTAPSREPVPQPDPRPDLCEDSALWGALLTLAHQIDGDQADGAYAALDGARCCGVRLERTPAGLHVLPGEMGDAYAALRDDYLVPHVSTMRWLLRRIATKHGGTQDASCAPAHAPLI